MIRCDNLQGITSAYTRNFTRYTWKYVPEAYLHIWDLIVEHGRNDVFLSYNVINEHKTVMGEIHAG